MTCSRGLLLIGGGGHCHSVLDCVRCSGIYERIGIVVNDRSEAVPGAAVVGSDNDLPQLLQEGWTDAFISVGSIGPTALRRRLYRLVKEIGFEVPVIIDPSAAVAGNVECGEGVFIGKRAVINTGSRIGCCAILNTGSIIEHDCVIGDFSHVSSGTTLCGQVTVGSDSHIGAGTVVRQGITVGISSLIGIGSTVVKNIPDGVKAYGNPCMVVDR